ncbi:MAG: transcription elongation factor Spt5 [Thermoplasmata archaeon]|nr:transcription elongation factor Spt5 [Thermoplasmata archaeon]
MEGDPDGIGLLDGSQATPAPSKPAASAPASTQVSAPAFVPPTPAQPAGELKIAPADDAQRQVTAGTVSTLSAVVTTSRTETVPASLVVEVAYTSTYPGEGAEWPVRWLLPGKRSFADLVRRKETVNLNVGPNSPVAFSFEVEAPVGVRYGDRVELRLSAQSEGYAKPARLTLSWEARQSVLAIKTSRGYEREVADTLLTRAEEKPDVLFSLLVPAALRGYVFAEGMSFEGVREMLKGIRKARGLVDGETTLKEVEPLLVPRITVEGFVEGAIVELVAGPFKGEKARVKKIDQAKEEITVELIEAVVPIPVTVRGDHVRMLEKGSGKAGG